MIHYAEFPPASLSPFIECIWLLKSHTDYFNKRELIIPGGRIEMIFNLGDGVEWIDSQTGTAVRANTGAYLLGPRNRPFFVEHQGAVHVIGVRFRHGGLSAMTPMPMTLLMNAVISADHVFGREIHPLVSMLADDHDDPGMIAVIEDFLAIKLQEDPEMQGNLRLISWVKDAASVTSSVNILSENTGVHYKKLERIFARYTGYNPKNFSRVIRFYKAAKQIHKAPRALTGVGLNNGYYDQSHFIRDFKAFTGKSPSQFSLENPTIANLLLKSKHV
jgi:AraC-like DNA-binding protein